MLSLSQHRLFLLGLFILWALFFLGHSWEEGLKMDAMENASIAKHVLATGNWKVFQYSSNAYPEYYNHPPLVIWIEALFFKLFGVSDAVARLVPAFFGLGTVWGVVYWGMLNGSVQQGLLAGFILLTSNRYIKFASDVLLEGPLCFFLVWGTISFLKAVSAKSSQSIYYSIYYSIILGLCLAGAFLTKSIFFVILPLSILGGVVLKKEKLRSLLAPIAIATGVFISVLGVWFIAADGFNFLRNHYSAISYRVENRNWATALAPGQNILKSYWPWLPFFCGALYLTFRERAERSLGQLIAISMVGIVFIGFSLSGHFFEHYLTSLYPAAAIVGSLSLCSVLKKHFAKFERGLLGLAVLLAVLLAIFPIRLRRDRAEPLRTTLKEMSTVCRGQSEILVTQNAMDRWLATAIVLWTTSYEVRSISTTDLTPQVGQLLITAKDENPQSEIWVKVPLCESKLNLYQSRKYPLCRQE